MRYLCRPNQVDCVRERIRREEVQQEHLTTFGRYRRVSFSSMSTARLNRLEKGQPPRQLQGLQENVRSDRSKQDDEIRDGPIR